MVENAKNEHWHLDKRISVGHVVTTLTVIFGVLVWSFQVQRQIDSNELRIQRNADDIQDIKTTTMVQYTEIIRRLEVIDERYTDALKSMNNK